MDEVDAAEDRIEHELAAAIKKARTMQPHFPWEGSCWCGEMEWSSKFVGHFCGPFCRDLYEREQRQAVINGKSTALG
jgi:hypothetical protein